MFSLYHMNISHRYELTSQLLDTHDVVQPFQVAQWMNINYTTILRERPSYLNVSSLLTAEERASMKSAPPSHEGFAWAFRRPLYQAMGGMPEFAVLTGGDTIVALAVSPIAIRTRFFLHQLGNYHMRFRPCHSVHTLHIYPLQLNLIMFLYFLS